MSSLAVLSDYREEGIGRYLVKSLIEQAHTAVYLSCGSNLESFYRQSGFERISWSKLPTPLKLEFIPFIFSNKRLGRVKKAEEAKEAQEAGEKRGKEFCIFLTTFEKWY